MTRCARTDPPRGADHTQSVGGDAASNPPRGRRSPPVGALEAYDETLKLQGVTFRVECDNAASLNTLTLTPSGLEIDNSPITVEVDGIVTGAEVADLNADGSPEV